MSLPLRKNQRKYDLCLLITFLAILSDSIVSVRASEPVRTIVVDENDIPELKFLDPSVDPCDDFYKFSCNSYKQYHPLKDGALISDLYDILEEELVQLARVMLAAPKRHDDPVSLKKAKSAYAACSDIDFLDNTLHTPELRIIEEFDGLPLVDSIIGGAANTSFSWTDIGRMVTEYGVPLLFSYLVYPQFNSESSFFVYIDRDSLSNPAFIRPRMRKSYDQVLQEAFDEMGTSNTTTPYTRKKGRSVTPPTPIQPFDVFLQTVAKHLARVRNSFKSEQDVLDDLDEMASFMRELYSGGITDGYKNIAYNYMPTVKELQKWTDVQFDNESGIDWLRYLSEIFKNAGVETTEDTVLLVADPKLIYGVINLVRQTDPAIVKNFAMLRVFLFLAPDSDLVVREAFENYYKAKNQMVYPRWEYCTRKIIDTAGTATLSFAVAYDYQRYFFNVNKLAKAVEMIKNIESAFLEILNESDWMDDPSRQKAILKAQKILVLLGYPEWVPDAQKLDAFYENVRICEWDNYGNARRMRAFQQAYLYSQLGKARDRAFWDKSAFDVNAYYNRPNNRIVFPVAMLNPVFFQGQDNLTVLDYSRIGSIIGHELTHGFDSSGQKYDENGLQITGLWSKETAEAFSHKITCFEEQYSKYFVEEIGKYVNGTTTVDEILADNGGIRESFRALRKATEQLGTQTATLKFTQDQLFFIGYATMWCSEESPTYLSNLAEVGLYPPNRYRVIGALSNMVEFAEAFQCPVDSRMNPNTKCVLW